MFTTRFKIIFLIALVTAIVLITLFFRPSQSRPPVNPSDVKNAVEVSKPASTLPVFTRDGVAGKIVTAVETLIPPREVAAAMCEKPGARFVCILVEAAGPEKYFQLDHDLLEEQFPFLKTMDFREPPFQVSRSMSMYRSEAKRVLNYDERTDRILVLICPKSEWANVRFDCPELKLPQTPASSGHPSNP